MTDDIIGVSRPQGLAWDVGAFEYIADGEFVLILLNSTNFSVNNREAFFFAVNMHRSVCPQCLNIGASCPVGGNDCGQVNVTLDPLVL